MKKIISIYISIVLLSMFTISSNANSIESEPIDMSTRLTSVVEYESYEEMMLAEFGMMTRGYGYPDEDYNLGAGSYDFSGLTHGQQLLYFNYWFTNHGSDVTITISSDLDSGSTYELKVIKYGLLFKTTVYTYTLDRGKTYTQNFGNALNENEKFTCAVDPLGLYTKVEGTVSKN